MREQRVLVSARTAASKQREAPFQFGLPVGVERQRVALGALSSLRIGSGVRIRPFDAMLYIRSQSSTDPLQGSFVVSAGELVVGRGSLVGSVYALGAPNSIDESVTIFGALRSTQRIENRARALLGSLPLRSAAMEQFVFEPPAPDTVSAVEHRADERGASVPPGAYVSLRVESGTVRRLRTGAYVVRELNIARNGILDLDNSLGPVEIWVTERCNLDGELRERALTPTVFVACAGPGALKLDQPFHGTLLAPRATLTLAQSESPHVGAFFANRIVVEDRAEILHSGFRRWHPVPSKLSLVCENCNAGREELARSCCAELKASLIAHDFAAADCMSACAGEPDTNPGQCRSGCDPGFDVQRAHARYVACMASTDASRERCELQARFRAGTCLAAGLSAPSVECAP
ncbi:MAG: hypothetical protein ACOY0T_14935 [Myxococcota bacterium]